MIKLTRLNGEPFILNADLIRTVDSRPDTYITLTTSDHLIVQESPEEVVKRSLEFKRLAHPLSARC